MTTIRKLGGADASTYRHVLLESLERHPTAFAAAYEEELAQPLDTVAQRLEAGTVFGGFVEGELVATATYERLHRRKRRHRASVESVYVRAGHRGTGVAGALFRHLMSHARQEVDQLELHVGVDNAAARRFYRRFGFEAYGVRPRSLRVNGGDHDVELMVMTF